MSDLELDLDDPERGVTLRLTVPAGRTTALVGPNGAGKSTVLAATAGTRPVPGRVRLGDRELGHLPPHRRRVPLLSQDPLLLPHLSVLDNVAFGPRATGARTRHARERAGRWLDRVEVRHLAGRQAAELSGGEAQRVALARALATEPDAVLLDEPLSALDVDARPAVRHVLGEVLTGVTALIVTHDLLDVVLLADDVVVLEDGQVVERGPVREVVEAPRSPFAARLSGVNLVLGRYDGAGGVVTDGGTVRGTADHDPERGSRVAATFRPDTVAVHLEPPGGSPRTVVRGRVVSLEPAGSSVRLRCATPVGLLVADLTPGTVTELGLVSGSDVHLAVKATAVTLRQV